MRSVVDFDSEDALRKALMAAKLPVDHEVHLLGRSKITGTGSDAGRKQPDDSEDDVNQDWVLPTFDPITTEAQSMKEELHRLQVLKSYLILDAEKEECFDRLTRIGAQYFKTPICLISLIDLGRQWFVSNVGLGDAREASRKHGICSHTILSKSNMLIVPDTTKDFRFKENPFVTGPPEIRFYAGAPLISPEGYKLGTFCIDDFKPRPDGLSEDEKESLRDFAALAVKELVKRKSKLLNHKKDADEMIAYTAHDLMTPLTAVHLSLSLLQSDEETEHRLSGRHSKMISSAARCSDLMVRICQMVIDTLRESPKTSIPSFNSSTQGSKPVMKISDIIDMLVMVMDPLPKKVPLAITLDRDVPSTVISDDLKLFRSALNLITNAIERTSIGFVHLRIYIKSGQKANLRFECSDTGPEIKAEEYQHLFLSNKTSEGKLKLDLNCVATMINSLDGEYGFCPMPGDWRMAVFWFSVPLYTPENFGVHASDQLPTSVIRKFAMDTVNLGNETTKRPIIPDAPPKSCPKTIYGHFSKDKNVESFHRSIPENMARDDQVGDQKRDLEGYAVQHDLQGSHSIVPFSGSISKFTGDGRPRVSQPVQRKRQALIIEDSLVVRKSLARALERQSIVTSQAVNGLEGLKSMKSTVYDFVLCDFLMPVMDGLDCVKQYREWERQHRPELQQYIVGISAHGGVNDGNKGINAGMNDFKPKPISMKTLTEIRESNEVTNLSKKLDDINLSSDALESGAPSGVSVPVTEQSHIKRPSNQPEFRCLESNDSLNDSSNDDNPCNLVTKKQKVEHEEILAADPGSPVCLVVTCKSALGTKEFVAEVENHGWKSVVVSSGEEAIELLMKRTWNAVLVDDIVLATGGTGFVKEFRLWEKNRSFHQPNVLMACSVPMPSVCDKNSVILPPTGFDGVLGKPLMWKQFSRFLSKSQD